MKSNELNISIADAKSIIMNVMNDEINLKGLDLSVYPITKTEYLIDRTLTKKYKLCDVNFSDAIRDVKGLKGCYQSSNKSILIFLNDAKNNMICRKSLNTDIEFVDLLQTSYHELRHAVQYQQWSSKPCLEALILNMEDLIRFYLPEHYSKYYDSYFSELDADLYGVKKTKDYMQKYPSIYSNSKKRLDEIERKKQYEYINYDFDVPFSDFCNIFKRDSALLDRYDPWLKIFFGNDGNLKSMDEIFDQEAFYGLENKLVYSILSSNIFLKTHSLENLNEIEKIVMDEALDYKRKTLVQKYNSNIDFPLKKQVIEGKMLRIDELKKSIGLDDNIKNTK